uniref:Putative secreted protein n=1 Tax=Xenopsylla cheopis TaxID=163159 RepID=A0A6M2DZY4_XENCH
MMITGRCPTLMTDFSALLLLLLGNINPWMDSISPRLGILSKMQSLEILQVALIKVYFLHQYKKHYIWPRRKLWNVFLK